MTPDQQRIAIAEACGWTAEQDSNGYWRAVSHKHGNAVELWLSERSVWSSGIPDYLGDLNAMHEAEKVFWDTGKAMEFTNQLVGIVCLARGFRWDKGTPDDHLMCLSHATAAQRAEAFLRTLGLCQSTPTQPQ
jgi:hypothetical protein